MENSTIIRAIRIARTGKAARVHFTHQRELGWLEGSDQTLDFIVEKLTEKMTRANRAAFAKACGVSLDQP